jgi:Ca2+-binding RTX toxin-like protein
MGRSKRRHFTMPNPIQSDDSSNLTTPPSEELIVDDFNAEGEVDDSGAELFELFPCAEAEPGYIPPGEDGWEVLYALGQGGNSEIEIDEMPLIVDNAFEGSNQSDELTGTDDSDGIDGLNGNDILKGLGGVDVISGGAGRDRLFGDAGNDRLYGDDGKDLLIGGAGHDNLQGGRGSDRLKGGLGDDFFRGDGGRDILIGGAGADAFILQSGLGFDIVQDFVDGEDRLGLIELTFEDLKIIQVGQDTVIKADDRRLAVLTGVDANLITAADFAPVVILG